MTTIGLRIDVDTLRGTRVGVPALVELLAREGVLASFFFSVGPDNMGRHLWRLLRPAFFIKMLRTQAAQLYGWDILLRGTFFPGPIIGRYCREQIRQAAEAGHEVGLHAWDHHKWQTRLEHLSRKAISNEIEKAYIMLTTILGRQPDCFAAPAWRMTTTALQVLQQYPFSYQADCRGQSLFRPLVDGHPIPRTQIPTTLPTYDELIGVACTQETYNEYLLGLVKNEGLNVLTIHAEVEGISCISLFREFIDKARQRNIDFVPLGRFLNNSFKVETSALQPSTISGREGWLACQHG